jgi:hypothetical protein
MTANIDIKAIRLAVTAINCFYLAINQSDNVSVNSIPNNPCKDITFGVSECKLIITHRLSPTMPETKCGKNQQLVGF